MTALPIESVGARPGQLRKLLPTVMIKDAVDDRDAGERVQVKNLSELVAKAMVRTSPPSETAPQ